MRDKQVAVRLSEPELAALQVLTGGASREEWLRVQIRAGITRRLAVNEAAIAQFHELAGQVDAREEKAKYLALIGQYEAENLVLYGARGGV